MELNPVDLYYEENGHGIPTIFLHGFPFDHSIWEPLIPMLQQETRMILPICAGLAARLSPRVFTACACWQRILFT